MQNTNIREAVLQDLDFVIELMSDALEPFYGGDHVAHAKRIFNTHISGGQDNVGFFSFEQKMFILEYHGSIAGMIHLVGKRQGTYKISPLIVSINHRNTKGLGSALLDFAEAYVKEHGAKQLYCTVAEINNSALQFFIKKGFIIAGKSQSHYKEGIKELMLYKPLNFEPLISEFENASITIVACEKLHYEQIESLLLKELPKTFKDIDNNWVAALFKGYERQDTHDINLKYKLLFVALDKNGTVCGVVGATPKKGEPIKLMPFLAINKVAFLSLLYDIPYLLKEFGRKLYIHIVPDVIETILLQRSGWSLDAMLPGAYHDTTITQQWSFDLNKDNFMRMLRVRQMYLNLIKNGHKTLEIRVGYSSIKKIQKGEKINMVTMNDSQRVSVKDVRTYNSFSEMLEKEDYTKISELKNRNDVLNLLKTIYPPDKEKLGVVVLDIETI